MIRYEIPATAALPILSISGTIPANRMNTLSSQPFIILPALAIPADRLFIPISFSALMSYATTGLTFPMALTYDQALEPFGALSPTIPGSGLVTAACTPYYGLGSGVFDINNINNAVKPALVWKAVANSPGADFIDVPYRIYYILDNILQ